MKQDPSARAIKADPAQYEEALKPTSGDFGPVEVSLEPETRRPSHSPPPDDEWDGSGVPSHPNYTDRYGNERQRLTSATSTH